MFITPQQLEGKSLRDRAILKAQAHTDAWVTAHGAEPVVLTRDDLRLTVSEVQAPLRKGYNMLECRAFLEKKVGDKWLHVPADPNGHYRFGNPPVMVPDGTKRTVKNDLTGDEYQLDNFREAPLEGFETILWQTVLLVAQQNGMKTAEKGTPQGPFPDNMTTDTFYAATSDGYTIGSNATYSIARTTYGFSDDATTDGIPFAGQATLSGYWCIESAFDFDTSPVPDGNTVTGAALSIYSAGGRNGNPETLEVRARTWTTVADAWVSGDNLGGYTLLATINASVWGDGGAKYENFVSEAAFAANISKTGHTQILINSARHRLNNQPAGNEYANCRPADYTGTSTDPKLVVTHVAPATPVAVFQATYRRRR